MKFINQIRKIWLACLLAVAPCMATSDAQYLCVKDIKPAIEQILRVHVKYHALEDQIMARILLNYFQIFDPLKIYLLESEVDSYVKSSPAFLKEALAKFNEQDYSLFEELDRVIKKAIWRSRQWREALAQGSEVGLKEFGAHRFFGKSLAQLHERWHLYWSSVSERPHFDVQQFKQKLHAEENEYLYFDEHDKPLEATMQQHLFALNILKAFAASLDPHTAVFSELEAKKIREQLEQNFVGVGLIFTSQDKGIFVQKLIENGPCAKSGKVVPGDRLVSINGAKISPNESQDVFEKLDGSLGDTVILGFERAGKLFEVVIALEVVDMDQQRLRSQTRPCDSGGVIGYIGMDAFYENDSGISSEKDILRTIEQFKSQGELKSLILDLRYNRGGYLEQAVKVVGLFIRTGVVVMSKYSDGTLAYYRDTDPAQLFDGPILVMTSRMSASAAEIVSQALQDYGVGFVMGDSSTYGKGSIQLQTLTSHEKAQMYYKVTVGRYYTVSGRSTQLEGVLVDFVVPGPYEHMQIGERFAADPIHADSVNAAFADTLSDVEASKKIWFLQKYIPSLQLRSQRWKPIVPQLREASLLRQKEFFTQKPYERCSAKELEEFQLQEAYALAQGLSSE